MESINSDDEAQHRAPIPQGSYIKGMPLARVFPKTQLRLMFVLGPFRPLDTSDVYNGRYWK